MTSPSCPCCTSTATAAITTSHTDYRCLGCGHQWRLNALPDDYYQHLEQRNRGADLALDRKTEDRLRSIIPFLRDGMRIIEIGCAEGWLGAAVKERCSVDYVGVEISDDARPASSRLDTVIRMPASEISTAEFDLLLAFHVLEHITDIESEVSHWARLVKPEGTLILEVPHRAGHPLLLRDNNPEHLHFFSTASFLALLQRSGLQPLVLECGHFESPVYPDSLRIIATKPISEEARRRRLIQRFKEKLGNEFVVFGTGGDYRNYVEPFLDELSVTALCDSDINQHGRTIGRLTISAYDPLRFAKLPILVASLRFKSEITDTLRSLDIPASSIFGLDDIYGENE